MRDRSALVVAIALVVLAFAAAVAGTRSSSGRSPSRPPPAVRDVTAYAGLGAWIDVYDVVPSYQRDGAEPPLDDDVVERLVERGVETLYLQAARHDAPGDSLIVDEEVVGSLLATARDAGLQVVGWYLPTFTDVDADLARLVAIAEFAWEGHRFDGVAVDIEYRESVADAATRSHRLVELSRRLRTAVGGDALGAIVLPPVLLEVVNPESWPGFPWSELASLYDVWLPMSYWTFRSEESGHRDGHRYTEESITRLRANVGGAARVHPIGGIADQMDADDYAGFARAAARAGSIGLSVYDVVTTDDDGWTALTRAARVAGAGDRQPG